MLDRTGEELPERWQSSWRTMTTKKPRGATTPSLQAWLEEVYFDSEITPEFSRADIAKVGELVQRLLRLEPTARASAKEILEDSWFQDV